MHLNFVCSLYEEQIRAGRFFLHEHPAGATSWEEPSVRRIKKLPDVRVSRVDACQYGMTGLSHGSEYPVKKPTCWMSNMKHVNEALSKTCSGTGGLCSTGTEHVSCTGSRAEKAAVYPLRLCRAILFGIRNHLRATGWLHEDTVGIMMEPEEESSWIMSNEEQVMMKQIMMEREMAEATLQAGTAAHRGAVDARNARRHGHSGVKRTYDALTKQVLDDELVLQGKAAEMSCLEAMASVRLCRVRRGMDRERKEAHLYKVDLHKQRR